MEEPLPDDGLPVASDSPFQAHLRRLQSEWRHRHGLPIGEHRGRPLGSRLAMPFAADTLANYLTPTIRSLVRREVSAPSRPDGQRKLYRAPRIFEDLLSSQPLCFNLFGELAADVRLATDVARRLWPGRVDRVTSIEFEWSPGRGDRRYLGNGSAFDVVVFHTCPQGGLGFIGIEVKYHEDLVVRAARHRERYDDVAGRSGAFVDPVPTTLATPPLQQLWLDHLLALSMLGTDRHWARGLFVLLHPAGNTPCERVAVDYRAALAGEDTFERRTLEEVVRAIDHSTDQPWVGELAERYLGWTSG